jgi:hypothetical protein
VLGGSGGYTVAELLCKSRRNASKQHEPQHPEVSTAVACEVFSVRSCAYDVDVHARAGTRQPFFLFGGAVPAPGDRDFDGMCSRSSAEHQRADSELRIRVSASCLSWEGGTGGVAYEIDRPVLNNWTLPYAYGDG